MNKLVSLWKLVRGNDWWHYKLPVFLTITYVFLFSNSGDIFPFLFALLKVLLSICLGGAFVGLLNEYYDLEVDYKAGKIPKPTNESKRKMKIGLIVVFFLLLFCGIYFYASSLRLLCIFFVPIISFCLYSIPPFRFKNRGILGVFCDAIGAVVTPQLLIILSLAIWFQLQISSFWLISLLIWSFCFGLRGILWHQFQDRRNDRISQLSTFAVNFSVDKIPIIAFLLVGMELFSMVYLCSNLTIYIQIGTPLVYFLIVLYNRFIGNEKVVLIVEKDAVRSQFLFLDYYLFILPLLLLFYFSFENSWYIALLFLFFILFPKAFLRYYYKVLDVLIFTKNQFFKYVKP